MKLLKRIYHKLFKKNQTASNENIQYFDNPPENLALSNIHLDVRNPLPNKKYIRVGKNSSVNATCIFETPDGFIDIKDRVFMGESTIISKNRITIDENVQIAWGCTFYDHNAHSFDYKERQKDIDVFLNNKKNGRNALKNEGKDWSVGHSSPIHICHDAWIGMNVTILNGVTIGAGAIIGAGSVVRSDIPSWSIATGNPCKVIAENRYKPDNTK